MSSEHMGYQSMEELKKKLRLSSAVEKGSKLGGKSMMKMSMPSMSIPKWSMPKMKKPPTKVNLVMPKYYADNKLKTVLTGRPQSFKSLDIMKNKMKEVEGKIHLHLSHTTWSNPELIGRKRIAEQAALTKKMGAFLGMWGDADRDGVPNILDCSPFNRRKQDTDAKDEPIKKEKELIGEQKEDYESTFARDTTKKKEHKTDYERRVEKVARKMGFNMDEIDIKSFDKTITPTEENIVEQISGGEEGAGVSPLKNITKAKIDTEIDEHVDVYLSMKNPVIPSYLAENKTFMSRYEKGLDAKEQFTTSFGGTKQPRPEGELNEAQKKISQVVQKDFYQSINIIPPETKTKTPKYLKTTFGKSKSGKNWKFMTDDEKEQESRDFFLGTNPLKTYGRGTYGKEGTYKGVEENLPEQKLTSKVIRGLEVVGQHIPTLTKQRGGVFNWSMPEKRTGAMDTVGEVFSSMVTGRQPSPTYIGIEETPELKYPEGVVPYDKAGQIAKLKRRGTAEQVKARIREFAPKQDVRFDPLTGKISETGVVIVEKEKPSEATLWQKFKSGKVSSMRPDIKIPGAGLVKTGAKNIAWALAPGQMQEVEQRQQRLEHLKELRQMQKEAAKPIQTYETKVLTKQQRYNVGTKENPKWRFKPYQVTEKVPITIKPDPAKIAQLTKEITEAQKAYWEETPAGRNEKIRKESRAEAKKQIATKKYVREHILALEKERMGGVPVFGGREFMLPGIVRQGATTSGVFGRNLGGFSPIRGFHSEVGTGSGMMMHLRPSGYSTYSGFSRMLAPTGVGFTRPTGFAVLQQSKRYAPGSGGTFMAAIGMTPPSTGGFAPAGQIQGQPQMQIEQEEGYVPGQQEEENFSAEGKIIGAGGKMVHYRRLDKYGRLLHYNTKKKRLKSEGQE